MRRWFLLTFCAQSIVLWLLIVENRRALNLAHRANEALAASTHQLEIDAQALRRCTALLRAQQAN